ncbi:MAG: glycosyltransferase family 4 protein [Acidobacteria bacterium]|nr:glycosyltransferase family 4 protein [Acidobacteriota bacterium]MCA1639802.1 glycosyltransferase family 4 protein [Acidobacteriota bacterium]
MRILQISSAKNFGGGERHLVDLTKGLINRRHDLFLAAPRNSPVFKKIAELPKENVLEVNIKNSLDIFAARKISKFVREKEIEIVHAHLAKDYLPASLAVHLTRRANLVLTRHVLFPMKKTQKHALKNVSKIIAVSSAVKVNLQKTFPSEKIIIIPNGIDIENWASVDREKLRQAFRFEHNISFDALLIGTVGELKLLKGQRDFVLAAQQVAQKFPEAHFVVVGKDNSSKQNFRCELKRLVKVFGLENRFLWLDWIEETAPLLSALDIFVSASHSESFGLAILEAMASGCAIVSTETEGAKELIEDEKMGKLVPVENPNQLAKAIIELSEDKQSRGKFGKNAQKSAKEKFGSAEMISKTEKIYRQVLRMRND